MTAPTAAPLPLIAKLERFASIFDELYDDPYVEADVVQSRARQAREVLREAAAALAQLPPRGEPVAWMVTRDYHHGHPSYGEREFFATEDEAIKNASLGMVDAHVRPLYAAPTGIPRDEDARRLLARWRAFHNRVTDDSLEGLMAATVDYLAKHPKIHESNATCDPPNSKQTGERKA